MTEPLVEKFCVQPWNDVETREREALGLSATGGDANALCLSGGGVRSAAFCLGALQALAERQLLDPFHYLSTVSGGGFMGGWLTRWLADRGAADPLRADGHGGWKAPPPDLPALDALRCYTNYLTPEPGLASNDTWQGIVLWFRNTLINWALFAPLLLVVACLAILYVCTACVLALHLQGPSAAWIALCLVALACLTWAVHEGCVNLPSHKHPDHDPATTTADQYGPDGAAVFRRIIVWSLAWAALAPLAAAPLLELQKACGPLAALFHGYSGEEVQDATLRCVLPPVSALFQLILPIGSFVACVVAYGAAWFRIVCLWNYEIPEYRDRHNRAFLMNFRAWAISAGLSALLLWVGIHEAAGIDPLWVAAAGPPWVVLSDLLRTVVYVALRREGIRTELDREWLARLNGSKARLILALGLAALAVLYLPTLLTQSSWRFVVSAAGLLTGPVVAKLGSSALTAFQPSRQSGSATAWIRPDWIITPFALVFITTLFIFSGRIALECGLWLAGLLQDGLIAGTQPASAPPGSPLLGLREFMPGVALVLLACALMLALLSARVKINRFTMHAVYRNRLVRAFLGSARDPRKRRPDRYTGFDPTDNLRMVDSLSPRQPASLFPVINVTMNVTSGKDTARAERKAAPFTITPLHCGSPALRQAGTVEKTGAYVATRFYAGGNERETGPGDKMLGISLGTAMAISGAAVSPNMGYHSSPLTAFVMTLFNLRLGAWLPNPGMAKPYEEIMKRSSPRNALMSSLRDLGGQSSESGDYLYLSDGGHFDNLGLYEMLRRRCRRIVVIDAGHDENYAYSDLGRALQHALIDMGVEVDFLQPIRIGNKELPQHGAYASVSYADAPGQKRGLKGELLYIKPWLPNEAPTELQAFKALNQSFPHANTLDQFFTESDFESYRKLGEYLAGQVIGQSAGASNVSNRFARLEAVFNDAREAALAASSWPARSRTG